jgi:hypothetical protein
MDNIPTEVYRDIETIVKDHLMDMHEAALNEASDNGFFGEEEMIVRLVRNIICENI